MNDEMEASLGTRAFQEIIDNTGGFCDLLYGLTIIKSYTLLNESVPSFERLLVFSLRSAPWDHGKLHQTIDFIQFIAKWQEGVFK